jgi:aspartate/glutamate racemase
MAILREARQSRLKMCQIPPFLSPHSIFDMLPLYDTTTIHAEAAVELALSGL